MGYFELAMPDRANKYRVNRGQCPRLGWREDSVADAKHNEEQDRQSAQGIDKGAPYFGWLGARVALRFIAASAGNQVYSDHQEDAQHQAWHHTTHEKAANRHVGDKAVNDEPDARRDDRCDHCRAG